MAKLEQLLDQIHARWRPLDERVEEVRENIRRSCDDLLQGESFNRSNERQVEEYIEWLKAEFPGRATVVERTRSSSGEIQKALREAAQKEGPQIVIERQRLSKWAVRTTRWNYVFTVPGETSDSLLLVAHYDTWRGPGADDNTTGEEILKQYLLTDLKEEKCPRLTHIYFLAGSEECGLVGLLSQLLLAGGITAGIQAWEAGNWPMLALSLAACPLASYRIGVSGSREYVRVLADEELERIKAVVSVDSVGEGRLFIPRSTLGADFIRALIPFGDYDAFTDVLEEGAHLHDIKYNNYIAGGTTDHVSFLEVNNGLLARVREWFRRMAAGLQGKKYTPPLQIPASALVAMLPGKASPVVFGGKIHTSNDTADRVYPEPLREALSVLDYLFYVMEGGARPATPRKPEDCHYARLYEISGTENNSKEYWVAMKDAIEPNRRNLNVVFRATGKVDEKKKQASVTVEEPVGWGVDTRLRDEIEELTRKQGKKFRRVRLHQLHLSHEGREFRFERKLTGPDQLRRYGLRSMAWFERQMGAYSFITFFGLAFVIAEVLSKILELAFRASTTFLIWFFDYAWFTFPFTVAVQIAGLLYLMAGPVPTWIDNHYRHENRSDNLGSLRRV